MLSQLTCLTRSISFYKNPKVVTFVIISALLFFPRASQCQPQSPEHIILETKKFLREISSSSEVRQGVIVVAPLKHKLEKISYQTDTGVKEINRNGLIPHYQFIISEKIDLKTLFLFFENKMLFKVSDSFAVDADYHGQLVFLSLDIPAVKVDTFSIRPPVRIDTVFVDRYIRVPGRTDTLVCYTSRKFHGILGYSLLPGGGRFYAGHPWQGVALGILQVAPIPLAIYYNDQRLKYLDRARDAARRVDQVALNENFDRSQDFRLRAGIAIGVSAVAYLFNTFDVLTNVKEVRFQPLFDENGVRLSICKEF